MKVKQKILVVDDETAILDFLRDALLLDGFEVSAARCSSDAIRLMQQESFDAALFDIELEERGKDGFGPDGAAAAKILRDLDPGVAIVLFTRRPELYRKIGVIFDDHLEKPVDPYHLIAVIKNAIYQRRMSRKFRLRRLNLFGKLLLHESRIKNFYRLFAGGSEEGDVEKLTGIWAKDDQPVSWVVYHLPQHNRNSFTVGVASMVGCGFKCEFCLSGSKPVVRKLHWTEIVCQVLYGLDSFHAKGIFETPRKTQPCVNFTCEGEPFANLENVAKAIEELARIEELGFEFIITSIGLEQPLRVFLESHVWLPGVKHYWSVNSARQSVRSRIMPITENHDLVLSRDLYQEIAEKTGQLVTASFVFIPGVNDMPEDIEAIAGLFGNGRPFEVKLQPYKMHWSLKRFETATIREMEGFRKRLLERGVRCRIRDVVGSDRFAGCGTTIPDFDSELLRIEKCEDL